MSQLPQPDAWYDSQLRARNHSKKEFMAAYDFGNDEMQAITEQIRSYLDVTGLLSGNLALDINKTVLDQIIIDICGDERWSQKFALVTASKSDFVQWSLRKIIQGVNANHLKTKRRRESKEDTPESPLTRKRRAGSSSSVGSLGVSQALTLDKTAVPFRDLTLNIFRLNGQPALLAIDLLLNNEVEDMESAKVRPKHLNFDKFITSVANLRNGYQIGLHQIVCTVRDTQYRLDDSEIEFKSALTAMYAEHQGRSPLMDLHIIDDVNGMSTL